MARLRQIVLCGQRPALEERLRDPAGQRKYSARGGKERLERIARISTIGGNGNARKEGGARGGNIEVSCSELRLRPRHIRTTGQQLRRKAGRDSRLREVRQRTGGDCDGLRLRACQDRE